VTLQGVKPVELQLQPMEAEQLWKCVKGNDIWAFAVVECVTSVGKQLIPDDVQEVIEEYADIF
jgi:hypothetical protein